MKIGSLRVSGASVVLLVVQLAIVSSIAGKYLYQRWTCPRVWTRALAYDPELVMRGRYLSLQLTVDGCGNAPSGITSAGMLRNLEEPRGATEFSIDGRKVVSFPARIAVRDQRLVITKVSESGDHHAAQYVQASAASSCDQMRLQDPVNFYIAEHAQSPMPVKAGQELWIEVTVPPKGPPRPLQLALKQGGAWKPLAFQ